MGNLYLIQTLMSYLPQEKYSYTEDENIEMLIHSIKANRVCKNLRKELNLCRSTILGKLVEPEHCQDKAIDLIDCFQKVRRDEGGNNLKNYDAVFQCAKKNCRNI